MSPLCQCPQEAERKASEDIDQNLQHPKCDALRWLLSIPRRRLILGGWVFAARGVRVLKAPLHLDRARPDAPAHQTLPLRIQSGGRRHLRPVLAARVGPSRPENLGGGTSPGPHEAVEVAAVDGLGPDGDLSAQDELRLRAVEAFCWVVRVYKLPALGWAAPVVKGGELGPYLVAESEPLAATAVEVLQAQC